MALDTSRQQVLQRLQREQVLRGVADAIAAKGFAATTISDIAAAARASRSTVYAQFPDKNSALLALHADMGDRLLAAVGAAYAKTDSGQDWRTRLDVVVGAYVETIAAATHGERAALLEVASLGPEGRQARWDAFDRFAEAVSAMSTDITAHVPEIQPLGIEMSLGAAVAVNEMIQRATDAGPKAVLDVTPIAVELIARLMMRP